MRPAYAARALSTAALLCLAAALYGQPTAAQPAAAARSLPTSSPPVASTAAQSFAAEPYYLKSSSTVTTMNADCTGTRVLTKVIAVQSEAALRDVGVIKLLYSSQSEHADFVYARVVHSDGTTQETPVTDAIDQPAPITQQAPFYSDLQTKQLPIKSLRIGDELQWQARFTNDHPEAPGQCWDQGNFSKGVVILDESYELRVAAGLHVTVWTNPHGGAAVTESVENGEHIYRWTQKNLKPTVGAEAEAAKKAEDRRIRTPDEEVDLEQGELPSLAWTTFPDWATLGAWYRGLVADRIAPDDAIKAKVAELTAGKATDLEKAQAVYNFVSTRIRYIGVAFGIGRYQPHTAAEVFANQYGDCKDKHILLASMLSVLGLHADPVLVGAGVRFNSAMPSPESFNHLITRLRLDGKDVWLDSTEETGIWDALLKPIRDEDALLIPATGPASIVHTPVDLPFPQISTASLFGTLDKDLTSDSTFNFVLHGDDELIMRSILRGVSPAQYGDFVQGLMAGLGFGGTTSQPEIDHLDDPMQPLEIGFHYHRVKEKDWGENRITVAFEPMELPTYTEDQPATSAIELGAPRTETSTVRLQLPSGWNVAPPEAVHAHAAFATCDVTYEFKTQQLYAQRSLVVLQSKVPVKDAKQYQAWYDECGAGSVPYIQLMPLPKVSAAATSPEPKAPDAPAGTANVKPSDPKAASLIQQAFEETRGFDLDSARKHLDEAAAINTTEPNLWAAYAEVARLLGMNSQVFEDLQRELSYHPDEVRFYSYVANYQGALRDPKGELATLHAWTKAAPDSAEAATMLANLLLNLNQPADALREASDAMGRLGAAPDADLAPLRIAAAKANVKLGHAGLAANSVAPLLSTVTDPVQIDDVAHILAQDSTHVDEAAAAETKLITQAEADSDNWLISDNLRPILQAESRLAAEWATMSLILSRQGNFTAAVGYATAAIHANNNDAHDALTALNAKLHLAAVAAVLRADQQQLRVIPLGPARGHQGVIDVTLLLSDGKVIDVKTEKTISAGGRLTDSEEMVKHADLKAFFPPGSRAHLIRTGFVNCHSGVCELVLSPFDGIQVIQSAPPPKGIKVTNLPLTH